MNLTNSSSIEISKLVSFGHPPIETNNLENLLGGIVATRIENSDGMWRHTDRDNRMAHTHDIETISRNIAYCKHINYLVFITKNVFDQEMSNKNIVDM